MLNSSQILVFDRFRFDTKRLILWRHDGVRIPLVHKAAQLLRLLLARPGETIGKGELFAELWPEGHIEESNLTQTVYVLRQALADTDGHIIGTTPRRGYRLIADVRAYSEPNPRRPLFLAVPALVLACAFVLVAFSSLRTRANKTILLPAPILKAYQVGRLAWGEPTQAKLERSRRLFLSVTRDASSSPLGFAGLSDSYYSLSLVTPDARVARRYRALAKQNALHALALDQFSSEAHLALARAATESAAETEKEYATALALDQRNPLAHRWYGLFCLWHGRYACATSELETANALDPQAWQNLYWLGVSYYYGRNFQKAIDTLTEAMRIRPKQTDAQLLLAFATDELGRPQQSDAILNALAAQHYDVAELVAIRAFNDARRGARARAAQEIAPILQLPRSKVPGAITVAGTLVALGQTQKAHWWLKNRYTPDDASIFPLKDPRLDGVRQQLFGS